MQFPERLPLTVALFTLCFLCYGVLLALAVSALGRRDKQNKLRP